MDNVKVLIFDMDDTLINHGHVTKPTWIKTVKDMAEHFHLDIDTYTIGKEIGDVSDAIFDSEERRPKGNYDKRVFRTNLIKEAFSNVGYENDDVIDYLIDKYDENKHKVVYIFEDVLDTLVELKKRGYIITMLTNGDTDFQWEKINRLGFPPYFDRIFVSGEHNINKPEKSAYELVVNTFGVTLEEACMIGDNYLWEVVAPIQYGMKAIWMNKFHKKKTGDTNPDYTIENISELLEIFK